MDRGSAGYVGGGLLMLVAKEYGLNIGAFIADHPNHVISAGFEGIGYQAQRKSDRGHGVGHRWSDLTLDGLAGQLEEADAGPPAPGT
jgi:hypothetical protein